MQSEESAPLLAVHQTRKIEELAIERKAVYT